MSQLIEVVPLSKWLGIPAAWLQAEANAGRIPCLNAGGVLLFDVAAVRRALAERAAQTTTPPAPEVSSEVTP